MSNMVICLALCLLDGQPSITYVFRSCKYASFGVASFISHISIYVVMSVAASVVCMLDSKPTVSLSLFCTRFCLISQSVMHRSSPGLYIMCILYWCIFSRIHYSFSDSIGTSFLELDTNGYLVCDHMNLSGKAVLEHFWRPCSIPIASPSVFLYHVSMLDRFLLGSA